LRELAGLVLLSNACHQIQTSRNTDMSGEWNRI
jgi:hypothetical protein